MTSAARAWRCRRCTCLTIRARREPDPTTCDRCGGPVDPITLRRLRTSGDPT